MAFSASQSILSGNAWIIAGYMTSTSWGTLGAQVVSCQCLVCFCLVLAQWRRQRAISSPSYLFPSVHSRNAVAGTPLRWLYRSPWTVDSDLCMCNTVVYFTLRCLWRMPGIRMDQVNYTKTLPPSSRVPCCYSILLIIRHQGSKKV